MSVKPFVWVGPGVLWLDKVDDKGNLVDRNVIHPAGELMDPNNENGQRYTGVVRKAKNLELLTDARAKELEKEGRLKFVPFMELASDTVTGSGEFVDDKPSESDAIIGEAVKGEATIKANADIANKARLATETAASAKQPDAPAGAGPK